MKKEITSETKYLSKNNAEMIVSYKDGRWWVQSVFYKKKDLQELKEAIEDILKSEI